MMPIAIQPSKGFPAPEKQANKSARFGISWGKKDSKTQKAQLTELSSIFKILNSAIVRGDHYDHYLPRMDAAEQAYLQTQATGTEKNLVKVTLFLAKASRALRKLDAARLPQALAYFEQARNIVSERVEGLKPVTVSSELLEFITTGLNYVTSNMVRVCEKLIKQQLKQASGKSHFQGTYSDRDVDRQATSLNHINGYLQMLCRQPNSQDVMQSILIGYEEYQRTAAPVEQKQLLGGLLQLVYSSLLIRRLNPAQVDTDIFKSLLAAQESVTAKMEVGSSLMPGPMLQIFANSINVISQNLFRICQKIISGRYADTRAAE